MAIQDIREHWRRRTDWVSRRIAIVGSGISGLGAAWALNQTDEIHVYEAESRVGGHSHTVDVAGRDGVTSVDTGFIVYNERTYPNLTRLFSTLGVPTEPSDMSLSVSFEGRTEYAASVRGVLGVPTNLLSRRFITMLIDLNRFRRIGPELEPRPGEPIGELLQRHSFGPGFIEDYLYPMTGAIWSAGRDEIANYPASSLMAFMHNHGLIEVVGRPLWRTVSGGSRSYVRRLTSDFSDRILTSAPVQRVKREPDRVWVTARGVTEAYDEVVLTCHSDQALRILGDHATADERRLLGAIRYQPNDVVLHSDPRLMPRRRRLWSSWNALAEGGGSHRPASVTYWMNRLQNLNCERDIFVSLNPRRAPRTELVHGNFRYAHPIFDESAIGAQTGIARIQGRNRTWFAGAYLGFGFHEDGLQAGLNVAAALGSPAPWHGSFAPSSSTPAIEARAAA